MTDAVHDYKSIARKLHRQEQKAEYEAKNPEQSMYGWPYGVAVPFQNQYQSEPSGLNRLAGATSTSKSRKDT